MDTYLGVAVFPFIICRDLPLILLGASLGCLVSRRFSTGFQWSIQKHQPDVLLPFGWSWMEKEPFVPSPPEAFAGSGQLPPHANGADTQVENELCVAGSGQARLPTPPGSRETCIPPPLHIGEAQRNDFSPKRNCSGGSLGMAYLPTAPRQGCAPKDERRMLAYLLLSAPFAPTKATYIKQKGCTGGGGLCGGLLREKSSEGLTRGVLALLGHDRKWSDREVWASSCWSQQDRTSAYPVSSSCCSFPKGATEEFFSSETFSSYQWATLYCCCNT